MAEDLDTGVGREAFADLAAVKAVVESGSAVPSANDGFFAVAFFSGEGLGRFVEVRVHYDDELLVVSHGKKLRSSCQEGWLLAARRQPEGCFSFWPAVLTAAYELSSGL